MDDTSAHVRLIEHWIDRLRAGDETARAPLLEQACERLRRLTRKMLRSYAGVKRWEETDDVLQNALIRLWGALRAVTPHSAREFYGLANLQIRRELIDLARQYYGPQGAGAHHASGVGPAGTGSTPPHLVEPADETHEPGELAVWSEFHQWVDRLPEEEREVFDLLWYQELTHPEAAAVLGISEATLRRRWLAARQRLHDLLRGQFP